MAFIQQLYKSEVHWGTLREKLTSQIPHPFQNSAQEDGIWVVLNHTLLSQNYFSTCEKDLFSILCPMVSPNIPDICSLSVVAHHIWSGTFVGAERNTGLLCTLLLSSSNTPGVTPAVVVYHTDTKPRETPCWKITKKIHTNSWEGACNYRALWGNLHRDKPHQSHSPQIFLSWCLPWGCFLLGASPLHVSYN